MENYTLTKRPSNESR